VTALEAQAAYYVVTGVWPLLDRDSFEAVTGGKTDFWLVRAVEVTVTAVGVGLALAVRRGVLSEDMRAAAALAAAGLGAIDVVYVARRRIRPVYLLDAVAQAVFLRALLSRTSPSRGAARRPASTRPSPAGAGRS
jgi:hypothetical protein